MKKHFILFVSLILCATCFAQLPPGQYSSTNKKAISIFEDAVKEYTAGNDDKAKEGALKAIEKDPTFIEPHMLLAEIYETRNQLQSSIDEYVKAITINPKFNLSNFFNLAQLEIRIGKYEDAKKDYLAFLKKPNINPDSKDITEQQLDNCNFAIEAMKHPVPFDPKNMGEAINSNLDEYFPAVTADDQTFLYTRNNRTETIHQQEDFMISTKKNGVWQKSQLIGYGINTPGNEGAPTLSADGQLLFFTVCVDKIDGWGPGRRGIGACDIFYTEKVGNGWSKTFNLGNSVNSEFRETQPSFSADGKHIYFVSNRPGGYGHHDIYVATLNDNGAWEHPVNLGNRVNSPGDEESVCISTDGRSLYFGSNGHTGMGGYDIYLSRMDDNGNWGAARNLGYPINTYADDHSLLVHPNGALAYIASNRAGGFGGLDLYQFELYEDVRPGKITYVKGKVYDAKTKAPLGAHFELIDLESAKTMITSDANTGNGEFLVTLPVNKNYALNVSMAGYLFYSENFSLKEMPDVSKPFLMDVPLQPIDTGNVVELKNIFFETAKFDLKPESKTELNKLVAFLNLNKTLRIELSGHTDNVGDKKMNLTLSQNRAKSVYDYLIANGIDAKRLAYKGYGDTQPKVKNDTEENRAMNRRTEFKVIGK